MPIVFAAVVPHSPLLVPSVAKEHQRLSTQTRTALEAIAAEIYARQAQILIVLTPHGTVIPGSLTFSVNDHLHGRLADFGDPRELVRARGAVGFAHQLKEVLEDHEVPVQLQTFEELDYGTTVPLTFCGPHLPRILPIHVGDQSVELLLRFGQALYEACQTHIERIAILASADLIRRQRPDRTGRPQPLERTLSHIISTVDIGQAAALSLDQEVCGLLPILTLTAALAPFHAHGTIRSFEVVTRVGLLTASYDLGT